MPNPKGINQYSKSGARKAGAKKPYKYSKADQRAINSQANVNRVLDRKAAEKKAVSKVTATPKSSGGAKKPFKYSKDTQAFLNTQANINRVLARKKSK